MFFFSSRRRHTRLQGDWSSDVCSSDLTFGSNAGLYIGGCVLNVPNILPNPVSLGSLFTIRGDGEFAINLGPEIGRASCRDRVWDTGDYVIAHDRCSDQAERANRSHMLS